MFLGELRVTAIIDNLKPVIFFLNGIAARIRLAENTRSELEMAVEEAFGTVLDNAYPAGQPGDVLLRAELENDMLRVSLTDWGATRDDLGEGEEDSEAEKRLRLIQHLTDGTERTRLPGGGNTITLVKRATMAQERRERQHQGRELTALQTITQAMATRIDLDDLLRLIVDQMVDTLDAERGTLYLVDAPQEELYSKVLLEDTRVLSEIRVRIGEGIAGHVAATGAVVNIVDPYSDPRFNQAIDRATGFRTRTLLTAPMRNPVGTIIGVVQAINKRGEAFSTSDERMLMAIAAQAAISVETARLHAQELRQQLINQELKTAKRIQESLMPSGMPAHPDWQVAAFWQPAQNVAGDFYDFVTLPDGRWAFAIADVSGKGIPAALFMAVSATVLRYAMTLDLTPTDVLRSTNRALMTFNRDSEMFASILLVFLDLGVGVMECASAGHNPPLVVRGDGTTEYVRIPGVIAGMLDTIPLERRAIHLDEGDTLILYTDGITEATSPSDELFGENRLAALASASASATAQTILTRIVEAVTAFSGARGAFDDETLIVIRRAPSDKPQPDR